MLPLALDEDYRARWSLVEKHFCSKPNSRDGTPLVIRDYEGLKELSFVFFTGWLFCGVLNRDKDLVRAAILPMGKAGESSVLALYELTTHLAAPARRGSLLLDPDYFVCPLDRAEGTHAHRDTPLSGGEQSSAITSPTRKMNGTSAVWLSRLKRRSAAQSRKDLLWAYLAATVCRDPDLYGPMIGGSAFPINLRYEVLSEYLTGVNPNTV